MGSVYAKALSTDGGRRLGVRGFAGVELGYIAEFPVALLKELIDWKSAKAVEMELEPIRKCGES